MEGNLLCPSVTMISGHHASPLILPLGPGNVFSTGLDSPSYHTRSINRLTHLLCPGCQGEGAEQLVAFKEPSLKEHC